jgi:hypothetical protein
MRIISLPEFEKNHGGWLRLANEKNFFFSAGIEPRASCTLSPHSTTGLHTQHKGNFVKRTGPGLWQVPVSRFRFYAQGPSHAGEASLPLSSTPCLKRSWGYITHVPTRWSFRWTSLLCNLVQCYECSHWSGTFSSMAPHCLWLWYNLSSSAVPKSCPQCQGY